MFISLKDKERVYMYICMLMHVSLNMQVCTFYVDELRQNFLGYFPFNIRVEQEREHSGYWILF